MLRYKDIEKKEDGSRVRVSVSILIDMFSPTEQYTISVETCEPRKRTWKPVVDGDDDRYRALSMDERREHTKKRNLEVAGAYQINRALIGAWEGIKPELYGENES